MDPFTLLGKGRQKKSWIFTFIIPASTAPPKYTICFLRGGSSIRNRSFCKEYWKGKHTEMICFLNAP